MKRTGCIFWLLLITFFSAASNYNVFEENGRVGLKNEEGKVLIPAQYDALGWSNGTFSIVQNIIGYKKDDRWGLISLDNHVVTQAEYADIFPGDGPLIIARKKSPLSLRIATGCLNTTGKEVVPFEYEGIKLYPLRAIVFTKIGNEYKYGLIDLENKTLIPQQYKNVRFIGSLRYAVENFAGKTALFTENGKQVTGFSIDSISAFKKSYAIIYQDARQGLMDREGNMKAAPVFREVKIDDDGSLHSREADEWLFLDGRNTLLQKTNADDILPLGKNLLRITNAGFIRLEDYNWAPVCATPFSTLGTIDRGKVIFSVNHKYGIVRKNGTLLLQPTFDSLYADGPFYVAEKKQTGKAQWHILDSLGQLLNTKGYDRIYPFDGKIFPVQNRNYWGALNSLGKEIIACSYDSLLQQLYENIVVKFRGQYGIIDLHEEWQVTPRPNKLTLIADERYLEHAQRITYLKSFDGNNIYFSENKLQVRNNSLTEYLPSGAVWEIDLDGVIVSRQEEPEGKLEIIFPESEGLRAIRKNGQFGFIDAQGRLRIANRYDDVQPFQEQRAAIKIRGKWGFINHDDNIAVQPVYEEVSAFSGGFSLVRQKGLQGLIDRDGKQILPPRYASVKVLLDGNVLLEQDDLYGLANSTGRVLINPKYHTLQDTGKNFIIVERDGKYGVISIDGISTIPLIYDLILYDAFNDVFIARKNSSWTTLN